MQIELEACYAETTAVVWSNRGGSTIDFYMRRSRTSFCQVVVRFDSQSLDASHDRL